MHDFDSLDQLIDVYKKLMPKTVYLMKNKDRYDNAVKAISEITACAVDADQNAKVIVQPDPLTGTSLCLEIVSSLVVVDMIDKFCSALKQADNFEICPRTDGLIVFGVSFNNAFVPAPPHSESRRG
ncbi:MAG: hypothetical protein ACI4QI_00930 [Candidatus Coproplasma sp.]